MFSRLQNNELSTDQQVTEREKFQQELGRNLMKLGWGISAVILVIIGAFRYITTEAGKTDFFGAAVIAFTVIMVMGLTMIFVHRTIITVVTYLKQ